ncbi:hypothetical protein [Vitiosangium sp. GDMCC 1.1324]|uniref:hypothetical protein n=1 Tax=Vitiosangium sp. (strain GDMCC 1.1324) TaxID=2138576 RepID=UPI0018EE7A20|nr:hypothetical protein [Vitiosangium sp. GDMCC 1.1324]
MADVTCSSVGQGRCLDTDPTVSNDLCEGGTFRKNSDGSVTISGWNMLDLQNFFVTRDNFRHQAMDLSQVVRVLQGGMNTSLTPFGVTVDASHIDYVGQSLPQLRDDEDDSLLDPHRAPTPVGEVTEGDLPLPEGEGIWPQCSTCTRRHTFADFPTGSGSFGSAGSSSTASRLLKPSRFARSPR